MKRLKLKQLKLENWKAKSIVVPFNDSVTSIYAKNEVGKSSLIYAWHWLLTSQCNPWTLRNSDLFDNTKPLTHETPIASVKAWVEIDGYEYTLERRAKAKFTRARGTAEWVKASSDEYTLLIDNIETSVSDFNSWIERNICPIAFLPYTLSGDFFTMLAEDDKNRARKVLEFLVGEISFEHYKARDYTPIKEDLTRFSIERLREQAKKNIGPLRERIDVLPTLIEHETALLSEFEIVDYTAIFNEIELLKRRIAEIDDEILGQSTLIAPFIERRNAAMQKVAELTADFNERRAAYDKSLEDERKKLVCEINKLISANAAIQAANEGRENARNADEALLNSKKIELEAQEHHRLQLLQQRDEIKAKVFTEDRCAMCGQLLPEEELAKARSRFNSSKEISYELIVKQGVACRAVIESLKEDIAKLEAKVNEPFLLTPSVDTNPLEEKLAKFDAERKDFADTDEGMRLSHDIKCAKGGIPFAIEVPDNSALMAEKTRILSELDALNRKYGLKEKADEIRGNIAKMNDEQRQLANEIAKWESRLMLIQSYIEERANITSDRINQMLTDCAIRMWNTQKDGTIVPDCLIVDKDGVKFSTCSNSKRIRINVAIQELFRSHFGIELPTFIDEASIFSTTNLPKGNSQTIYLYASDDAIMKVV